MILYIKTVQHVIVVFSAIFMWNGKKDFSSRILPKSVKRQFPVLNIGSKVIERNGNSAFEPVLLHQTVNNQYLYDRYGKSVPIHQCWQFFFLFQVMPNKR